MLWKADDHRCVQSRSLKLGNLAWCLETARAATTGLEATLLRLRMIDAMMLHGFVERMQAAYGAAIRLLAEHRHNSPAVLSDEHAQGRLASSCCRRANGRARR